MTLKRFVALWLFACLVCPLLFGCASPREPLSEIPILPSEEKPTVYTETGTASAVNSLASALSFAGSGVRERILNRVIREAIAEAIPAFAAREVPEATMLEVVAEFTADAALVAAVRASLSDVSLLPTRSLLDLFGVISARLGAGVTSLLLYDLADIAFRQVARFYRGMYDENAAALAAYPQMLRVWLAAQERWLGYAASLGAMGEERFSRVLRALVSASTFSSLRDGVGAGAIAGLSEAELLLLLRSEARLLREAALTEQDLLFLTELAAEGGSYLFEAVARADGEQARTAAALTTLLPLLCEACLRLDSAAAARLFAGDLSGFLHALFTTLTDGEFAAFTAALSGEAPKEAYQGYLAERHGAYVLWERYLEFERTRPTVSAEALRTASEADFADRLVGYFNTVCPIAGFLLAEQFSQEGSAP